MVTADGMMPPRKNWIRSMNTKSSLTMGLPNMIPNQKGSQMTSGIPENQGTPGFCM